MKKVTLKDGKSIDMREPKVRDMMAVGEIENEVEREVALIGNLTELTKEEITDLTLADYKKLQVELKSFLS